MADPIVAPTAAVVTAAIQAMVKARPQARAAIEGSGYWSAVPKIIEAHTDVALARVVDEVRSARLRFAKGVGLRTLVASEFNLSVQPAPQAAFATLVLARGAGLSDGSQVGTSPAGVIKAGSLFSKQANPNTFPIPVAGATYQALQTVYVPAGAQIAMVPCLATSGPDGSVPTFTNTAPVVATVNGGGFLTFLGIPSYGIRILMGVDNTAPFTVGVVFKLGALGYFWVASLAGGIGVQQCLPSPSRPVFGLNASPGTQVPVGTTITFGNTQIQPTTALFDPNLKVVDCDASGGSSGIDDPGLVAAARANAIGQYGPTDASLVSAVLQQQSVSHYAFLRASSAIPYAQGYVADASWASSGLGLGTGTSWTDEVAAAVGLGFGCRVRWGQVVNLLASVGATVYLKTTAALAATNAIDANVRAAIRSYFDDRQDWYLFRLKGLASAIAKADPNIQQVRDVTVSDAVSSATLAEPALPGLTGWTPTLTHYYIGTDSGDNTVTVSYMPPI